MKIRISILALLVCLLHSAGCSNVSTTAKQGTVVIPAKPQERRISAEMRRTLERLEAESAVLKMSSWQKLREMPTWVLDQKEREYTSIESDPLVMDGFSHLVIIGRNRRTIVVRTGGFAGVYEIWEEPERPNKGPEPTSVPVKSAAARKPQQL